MKRKIAIAVAILMLLTCVVALAACGDEFTVTLDYGYDNKTETVTVGEGSIYVLPTLTRSGYTFAGWKDAGGKAVTGAQKIEADVTFTAQWTEGQSSVTVTFTVPTGAKAPDSKTAAPGDSITLPEGPEIEGQQFVGWELNEVLYEAGASVAIGKTNTTFTAVYANEVQIRYIITIAGAKAPAMEYALGGEIIEIEAAPQIDGYVFMGWKLANGKTYQAGDLMLVTGEEETVVLTADYREAVTLTFNYGEDKSFTMLAAKKGAFTMPDLELDADHVLKGWLLDGEGEPIAAGTTVLTPDEDASYTAEIKALYTVKIYDEKGQLLSTQRVEEGEDAEMPVYQYPAHLDGDPWYINYGGLDHDLTNVTESFEARPIYDAVPLDDTIFDYVTVGDGYQVRYSGYASGMGSANVVDLVLPSTYNGKAVTGIYTGKSALASTNTNTNARGGGFAQSTMLERVYIPASYTVIDGNAFSFDTALKEVVFGAGSKLETIKIGAFGFCSALTSIKIPGSVTNIGTSAFTACTALESITFDAGTADLTIGDKAFAFLNAAPKAADPIAKLASFTVPARTVSIGQYILQYQMALAELKFETPTGEPKALAIGNNAFAGVTQANTTAASASYPFSESLKSITIPARTTTIGNAAFANQVFLEEVKFETGMNLTSIGTYCFWGLNSLKSLTAPVVATINTGAFGVPVSTTGIKYFTKEAAATAKQAEAQATSLTSLTVPAGVTTINGNAFAGHYKLDTISFADSIQTLASNSFNLGTNKNNTALTKLALPKGLTAYDSAFGGNWFGLQQIIFECPNITSIKGLANDMNGDGQSLTVTFKGFTQDVTITTSFRTTSGTKSNFALKEVKFEECDNVTVTFSQCFYNNWSLTAGFIRGTSALTTVTLPKNVVLDTQSFEYMDKLTQINFAQGSKYSFANGAIYYTDNGEKTLVKYMWSNLKWADENDKVGYVTSLNTNVLQDVTIIGERAFYGVPLQSITIPASVTRIEKQAFYAHKLTTLEVPSTVEYVGENAFNSGYNLKTLVSGAKEVSSNAYSGAPELETATFKDTTEKFNWLALFYPLSSASYNSYKLTEIIFEGNTLEIADTAAAYHDNASGFITGVLAGGRYKVICNATLLEVFKEAKYVQTVGLTHTDIEWSQIQHAFVTETVDVKFGSEAEAIKVAKGGWIPAGKIPAGTWYIYDEADGTYTLFDQSMAIEESVTLVKGTEELELVTITLTLAGKAEENGATVTFTVKKGEQLKQELLTKIAALLDESEKWYQGEELDQEYTFSAETPLTENLALTAKAESTGEEAGGPQD